jgi:hypothetical protein
MDATSQAALCHALVAIGAEPCALDMVEQPTFDRLAELRMIQRNAGEWELMAVGRKLLPKLMDGDEIPNLISSAAA